MSDKKRKVPKLRFPGFTDAWEQRKVGEFLTESRVKGSNGKMSKKLTVKLWGKGVVEKNTIYRGSEATQYYTRFSGQFIYGKLDFLNQAFGIVPEELDGYESTLDSPAFDVSPALNKDFFLDYVSREQFYLVQGIIANGSRKAKRIHSDTFFEMPILLPEFNEQKVISDFTSKFDSLISLHQRKLDNVKMLKKSLLQKLFPKDGEKIPELRFPGFTDDWEQRKLESVLLVSTEKNIRNEYSRNEVLSVSREAGTVNQIEYQGRSFAGEDLSGYKVVHEGELIYTKSPLRGAPYGIFQVATIRGILSPLYAVYKSSNLALASFVATYLKNDSVATKYLAPLVTKGAKNTINVTDEGALKGKILIPQVAEQQRIYSLFVKIDGLLSLHQRKLDHLKELKKGLLQQMFV